MYGNLLEHLRKVTEEVSKDWLDQLREHLDVIRPLLDGAESEAEQALTVFDQVRELDIPLGDKFERMLFAIQEAQHKLTDFGKEFGQYQNVEKGIEG